MIGAAERRAGAIDVPKCPCQRRILLIASKTIKIEYLIQGHDIRLTAFKSHTTDKIYGCVES